MARLIFTTIMSLDGFVADEQGEFEWAAPDEEVHAFVNELERPLGTQLYGRRMYETMAVWDTPEMSADEHAVARDYAAIWQAADKIVYSRTLDRVSTARTRLERTFDPAAVAQLKASAGHDLAIGGPELAGQAIAAGLVDELQILVVPMVVGGGKRALPTHVRLPLTLVDERRFANGTVFLRYFLGSERA